MIAHHVHHADARYGHLGDVGAQIDRGSHQEATVAAALESDIVGRCIALFREVFGRGDEIVEDIELVELRAGLVPLLAVFGTAAQIGLGIDSSVLEPEHTVRAETGSEGHIETPVAI